MRIELTFPGSRQETADLKSGTGTSSVTSPTSKKIIRQTWPDGKQIQQHCRSKERTAEVRCPYRGTVIDKSCDFLYLGQALFGISLSAAARCVRSGADRSEKACPIERCLLVFPPGICYRNRGDEA